jgi:hypothetical protein
MSFLRRLRIAMRGDSGIGIVTVVFVGAVLTALVATVTVVTVNNLGNTQRDRQALAALATSEAGVAQALQFLRGGNLGALTCTEPAAGTLPGPTCQGAGPSWVSATNPMTVSVETGPGPCTTGSDCFEVWIGTVSPYVPNCPGRHATPPPRCYGEYRIHSTGVSGYGPSARQVAVDVKVSPYPFPIGVFAETFSGNGNIGIHRESVFTNGCISNRQVDSHSGSGFQFAWDSANNRPVLDLIYDQPAAAHATGSISTSNTSCGFAGGGGPIHQESKQNPTPVACNPDFRFDQDGDGGTLTPGDGCYGEYVRSDGTVYPTTSKFAAAELQKYMYRPRGLTDAQYDALRTQAQAQGTYNIGTGSINSALTNLLSAGITSPVLFWDNGDVSLHQSDFPAAFSRAVNETATCTTNSVTIVVTGQNHDLAYQGGNTEPYLVASIFVPDGQLTGSGGRNTIGTVFAETIDLGGSIDFHMDPCFAANPPGATLDVEVTNWREDDSKDIN